MKKSVVVFDFDGVLTRGGEGLKQRAWDILALPFHPDNAELLYQNMQEFADGKGSRYDILRATFEKFYAKDAELLTAGYADCYNALVQKMLEQSGMPEGAEQALAELAKAHQLFVNSATPEKAVRESVQHFHIQQYFRGIYGQPLSKEENLVKAQHIARVDKECMLFVGDSDGDAKAAKEFGCDFVGVKNEWNKWEKGAVAFPLIGSIAELPALLEDTPLPNPSPKGRE